MRRVDTSIFVDEGAPVSAEVLDSGSIALFTESVAIFFRSPEKFLAALAQLELQLQRQENDAMLVDLTRREAEAEAT